MRGPPDTAPYLLWQQVVSDLFLQSRLRSPRSRVHRTATKRNQGLVGKASAVSPTRAAIRARLVQARSMQWVVLRLNQVVSLPAVVVVSRRVA